MARQFYDRILASEIGGTIYIGVTNEFLRRVIEHKKREWKEQLIEDNNPNWIDLYPGIAM